MATTKEISTIQRILRQSPGDYFCISTKSRSGIWRDNFFERKNIRDAANFAISKGETHHVYMSPQGYNERRRHKHHAIEPHLLFADLDECDPRTLTIKPTIAIESSPGRYVGYWFTDKAIDEELNKRLAYYIGADVSGWDFTQVLRVPGTVNIKYDDNPKVKLLWDNGPRYQVSRIRKMVPKIRNSKKEIVVRDATDVYETYEKHMPRWLRKELTNPKVQVGKRSEVIWKMANELLELGASKDEIFTLLWNSEWNKHAERRGGERQLEREIDKIMGNHVAGAKKKSKEKNGKRFHIVTMAEVEEEDIKWYVPRMIAPGQTTIFEGDPGVGKSYFLMWLAIHFCDGKHLPWQDKHDPVEKLRVVYCDMENAAGSVTKVRLNDNGIENPQNYVQFQEPFSVDDMESVEAFEKDVIEEFKPHIVIIDPINLYVGGADTYKASETQQALQVLKGMAEDHGFALILVRHLNKSPSGKALYAGGGSIAFAGVARVIATIGWHPEETDMRVVACTKNNLSPFFGSLGYTIHPLPDTIRHKNRSRLIYEGRVDYTSDDIVGTSNKKDDTAKFLAADLIRDLMDDEGHVNYHTALKQGESRSITENSIKRAATELGMIKKTIGRGNNRRTILVKKDDT